MNKITLYENICLEPNFFNEKIEEHIFNKIIEKYTNYCDEKYGYIIKIYDGFTIKNNFLSNVNSCAYFTIKFKAKSLKPEIGDEIEANVFFIHSNGIMCKINEKLKIAISKKNIEDYEYLNNMFVKDSEFIKLGDKIKVIITSIRYEGKSFHLLGTFSEKINDN